MTNRATTHTNERDIGISNPRFYTQTRLPHAHFHHDESTHDTRARHARSSRQRYKHFVRDYRDRRLDDRTDEASGKKSIERARRRTASGEEEKPTLLGGKRREYLREYLRWLWPHRYGVATLFVLALIGAGLQMIEPLFMRYIIDRVLLEHRRSTRAARLTRLQPRGRDVPRGDPALGLSSA